MAARRCAGDRGCDPPATEGIVKDGVAHRHDLLRVAVHMDPGSAIVWTEDGGETWNDTAIECELPEVNPESLYLVPTGR